VFLIYINDILQGLTSTCRLHVYADNSEPYRKIDTLADARALQDDLQLLELWKMSFNVDKCMIISVTVKRTPVHAIYTLHDKELTVVEYGGVNRFQIVL